jgi:outer membrane protein assembly factor BamB
MRAGLVRLVRLVPLASIFVGAGCASTETANDRVNPENPTWYSRPSGAMHVIAHRTLTAVSRTVGEDYERGRAEIDAMRGRVFVGSADHGLYALRAGNGTTIWRFETLGVVQCEPLYDGELDVVYFGSHDGALYSVRAADGALLWRFSSGAEVAKKPVVAGEILLFANASDQLFALDRRTGKQRWTVHRTPALGMEVAGYAGPSYDATLGLVFMAYSDGHVIAYNAADGSEKWTPVDLSAEAEQSAGGDAPRYLDVDTTPVLDDGANGRVIYVAGYSGGVYALDAQTGSRLWANEKATGVNDLVLWNEPAHAPTAGGPFSGGPIVPAKKILLAASAITGLWGMDPTNGRMLWRMPVPEGGITAPVPVAGAVVVGTTRYGLFLISPRTGRVIDGLDLGSGVAQTPAAYGDRAYAMTNQGVFLGIQVENPIPRRR